MKSLVELCLDEVSSDWRNTDKSRGDRSHLGLYENLFEPYRLKTTKMFEIGINRGGSIRVWEKYFPNATVYGLDVRGGPVRRTKGDPIKTFKVDQSNKDDLLAFRHHGLFDIGIDDGSHIWSHQILSFDLLWESIKPGGLYVVEDTLTSYPKWLKKSRTAQTMGYDDIPQSTVEYFKDLVDHINFNGENEVPENATEFQRTIDWIAFRHNSIFIRKRDDA